MAEQESEGKVLGNFRAGFTTFTTALLIALLPTWVDEQTHRELLEQLRVICPVAAGGISYAISIPLNFWANRLDVKRYRSQMKLLQEEQSTLDHEVDQGRISEIAKELVTYRSKIFEIQSKSIFK